MVNAWLQDVSKSSLMHKPKQLFSVFASKRRIKKFWVLYPVMEDLGASQGMVILGVDFPVLSECSKETS